MISLIALFFCICNIQLCLGAIETGKVGYYDMYDLESCENDVGTVLNLELVKEGDEKWAQGNITMDYDFNMLLQYKYEIDRWSGTEWKNGYVKMIGNVCAGIETVVKKAFAKLIKALDPKPTNIGCNIPKGTYILKKFKALASDILLPNMVYGKYRGKLMIYKGTDLIACVKTVAEAKN